MNYVVVLQRLTLQEPKPTPLPTVILQIKPQPSTASLQKALAWSQASEATLNDGMPKCPRCATR
ncbi:hypothetical protein [uncultured Comamonas sp.]|uniref:hypothetical protein n=1 Tax=uncultured Comamonas sp. TaxID=114710 RepID=UPI00374A10DE